MQQRIVELLDKVANEEVTSKINKERFFLFSCNKNFTVQDISNAFSKNDLDDAFIQHEIYYFQMNCYALMMT